MGLEELRDIRIKKLEKAKKVFGNVYSAKVERDFSVLEAVENFSKLSRRKKPIFLAGRVFNVRLHGGIAFCDFSDSFGGKKEEGAVYLQGYFKKEIIGEEQFELFKELVDTGDFVEFEGKLFTTQKGQQSIEVISWRLISKALRPLPEKWHGLSDVEERYRRRYLDLLMNAEVGADFLLRSKLITAIRTFLDKDGFVEVETPLLQPMAGGALAEPFKTHHNALDIDLYLRIAPELYLKKLLVGGFEKVYEIGRNFRNEGIDATHNPEFTMLEFYQAYKDAEYGRDFVENMFRTIVKKIFGKLKVEFGDEKISFKEKFETVSFWDVIKRHALMPNPENADIEEFRLKAQQFGVEVSKSESKEKIADSIFSKICRPKMIQPVFLTDHPLVLSPLAKKKESDSNLVDRFQLIVGGLELANGYSELNDPVDQRERFEKQIELRKKGDKEAAEMDETYIEAMEYGMPPACGVGVGIDRLAMFFLNARNIRDVVLFPTLKPRTKTQEEE